MTNTNNLEQVYQVVSQDETGRFNTNYYTEEQLVETYTQVGVSAPGRLREELVGQPQLLGINGPMWGGIQDEKVVIRYETPKAYASLCV